MMKRKKAIEGQEFSQDQSSIMNIEENDKLLDIKVPMEQSFNNTPTGIKRDSIISENTRLAKNYI